jgi:alkylation response protein AidB-like acyl-CoA dehydrogenase
MEIARMNTIAPPAPRPTTTSDEENFAALLAAAQELRPVLFEHAAQVEAERRVPDEIAERIEAAGLWRMRRAKEFGGFGLGMRKTAEIHEEMARGCPSTAYMSAMLNGNDAFHAMYPRETQEELYQDLNARSSVMFAATRDARRVDGGWILSGRWPYATGILNAQWADIAFHRMDENGVSQGTSFALVPLSDGRIEDTWQVVSLVGTGSFSFTGENIFVPDARTFDYTAFVEAVPIFGVTASLSVFSSVIGMADGMLEAVREKLGREQPLVYTAYRRAMDSPSVQLNLSDAAQLIDGARLHAYRGAEDCDRATAELRDLTVLERARIRADVGTAASLVRKAAALLLNVGGPSGFATGSPIQRYWRDLELGSRHGYITSDIAREAYGKALLGLDVGDVTPIV